MLAREFETAIEAHEYTEYQGKYKCKVCGHVVKRTGSGGDCLGVPLYQTWEEIPEGITTKTMLSKEHKKKLAPEQKPVGAKKNRVIKEMAGCDDNSKK